MNVVINHHYQQMAATLHALVHTVLLSVQLDGDHKVDGESNVKMTTLGHIQNFHHVSLAQICLTNFLKSTKETSHLNQSSEKIFQACFQDPPEMAGLRLHSKKAKSPKSLKPTISTRHILKTILSDPIFLW